MGKNIEAILCHNADLKKRQSIIAIQVTVNLTYSPYAVLLKGGL